MKQQPIFSLSILVTFALFTGWYLEARIARATLEIERINPILIEMPERHSNNGKLNITLPKSGVTISSPVIIKGSAPGTWFFEATLLVKVVDKDGTILGQGPATAKDDWMTEELVPFEATLPFDAPHSTAGFVVIQADDPSGMGNAPSFKMPVNFSKSSADGAKCTSTIAGVCTPEAGNAGS